MTVRDLKIDACWLFVCTDPKDNNEGLVGMMTEEGWAPFVAADQRMVGKFKPHAQGIADASGLEVRLIKFGGAVEVLETYTPAPRDSEVL